MARVPVRKWHGPSLLALLERSPSVSTRVGIYHAMFGIRKKFVRIAKNASPISTFPGSIQIRDPAREAYYFKAGFMCDRLPTSVVLRRAPSPPLCRYVEQLWYSATEAAITGLESVLPTGTVQLVIRLQQGPIRRFAERTERSFEFEHGVVNGAHSRPFIKPTYRQSSVIGVQFRPAGASLFFADSIDRLANLHVAAEAVWGRQICDLREQLLAAVTPPAMFDLLEATLLRRLATPSLWQRIIQQAANQFITSPTSAHVRQIQETTGYSAKTFIRQFQQHVGLTPKVFCRVLRFQKVLGLIGEMAVVDWANIALTCGYFDQSHLIHDFREFAGISPTQYRPVCPTRRNHIAVSQ